MGALAVGPTWAVLLGRMLDDLTNVVTHVFASPMLSIKAMMDWAWNSHAQHIRRTAFAHSFLAPPGEDQRNDVASGFETIAGALLEVGVD